MEQLVQELVALRGETSKTYDLGKGKRRLIIGGGIQHWKEDYSDKSEDWKECDLRWVGNRIDKAPYILVRDGNKLTFTDRKTGEQSSIELVSSQCKDAKSISEVAPDYRIVPFNSGVHFQHYISADNLPFEAQFKAAGKVPISRAYDDIGELELEVSYDEKTGVLTERLIEIRAKVIGAETGQLRQASGEIRIDPTLTIQPCDKDGFIYEDKKTTAYGGSGYLQTYAGSPYIMRDILEFDQSALPSGATIDSATLSLYYYLYNHSNPSGRTIRLWRLRRYDWVESEFTWNIYKTGSNWGTAGIANTSSDIDTSFQYDATVPSSYGWMNWSVKALCEDARTNRSDKVGVRLHDASTAGTYSCYFRPRESGTTSERPKLVIEYTAAVTHKASAFFPFM